MMRKTLKIAGGVILLVVALGVSAVVTLSQMDFNRFKSVISAEVKAATGRELIIGGDITLKTALTPTLSVDDVSFANAPWSASPTMLTVRHAEARIDLWPLLSGTVHIQNLTVDGVSVLAEVSSDGKANWEVSASEPTKVESKTTGASVEDSLFVPHVSDVVMRNVHVRFVNHRDGQDFAMSLDRLKARARTYDSPIQWALSGHLGDGELAAAARTGSLRQLLESGRETFPVYLELKGPGLALRAEGGIDQPAQGLGVDVAVSTQISHARRLARVFGVDLPRIAETSVNFNLQIAGARYGLEDISVHSGRSDLGGRLDVDLSGARPKVRADFTAVRLDLDGVLPKEAAKAVPSSSTVQSVPAQRVFSAAPLPWGVLGAVDGTISVAAQKLIVNRSEIDNLRLDASVSDGALHSKTLSMDVGGGHVDAVVNAAGGTTPSVALRLKTRNVEVASLFKILGRPAYLDLKVDGDIDLHGRGESLRQIMAALAGRAVLVGRDGRLNDADLETAMTGVQNILPWINDKNATAVNCAVARFDVYRGLAQAQALMADATALDAWAQGDADLRDEKLNFSVSTSAKTVSLAKLALPFRVEGTFLSPQIKPDVGGSVISALGAVGGVLAAPAQLLGSLVGGDKTEGLTPACLKALGTAPAPAPAARPVNP